MHDEFIVFHDLLFFSICVVSILVPTSQWLIKLSPLINGSHHKIFKWPKSYIYVYRHIGQNSYGLPVVLYNCW